jgi:hypothetical protein
MIGYDRASETERVLVGYEDLINLNWLKIQSNPLGKLSGNSLWLRIMSGILSCAQQLAATLDICFLMWINSVKQIYIQQQNVLYNQLVFV